MDRHSPDEEVKHILCQGSSSLSRGLNAGPSEYEEKFGLPAFENYFDFFFFLSLPTRIFRCLVVQTP